LTYLLAATTGTNSESIRSKNIVKYTK